jgi:hypothetical protein
MGSVEKRVRDGQTVWRAVPHAGGAQRNQSFVSHSDAQAWVTLLSRSRSPATVRKVHRVLSLILAEAVKDGRLARNGPPASTGPGWAEPNANT